MALVLADRVRDTTTTTGTGTVTLSGTAPTGYQTFATAIGNANTTYYTINAGFQWEVGIGTYTTSGNTLTRTTVLSSSSAGSLVDFAAGTKDVFVTYPAEKSVNYDGSNNVGIGTTAPNGKMEVSSSASGSVVTALTLSNPVGASVNTGVALYFNPNGAVSAARSASIQSVQSTAGNYADMRFFTAPGDTPLERMRITSAGNVGIGTTAPATVVDASFSGGMVRAGGVGGNNLIQAYTGSVGLGMWAGGIPRFYSTGSMTFSVNSTIGTGAPTGYVDALTIDASGNLGIGTSAPGTKLEVFNSGDAYIRVTGNIASGNAAGIQFYRSGGSVVNAQISAVTEIGNDYGVMRFNTAGASGSAERMRINSAGNVLVGVTTTPGSPNARIVAGGTTDAGIQLASTSGGGALILAPNGAGAAFYTYTGAVGSESYTERMRLDSSGNLGVSATPSAWGVGFKAIQMQNGTVLASHPTVAVTYLNSNSYYDGTNDRYVVNGYASSYFVDGYQGGFPWRTAVTGTAGGVISFNERMRITSTGNVGINTSSPTEKLEVVGAAFVHSDSPSGISSIILRNDSTAANTTKSLTVLFQGKDTVGTAKSSGLIVVGPTDQDYIGSYMAFATRGGNTLAERMRISSAGHLLVGCTTTGFAGGTNTGIYLTNNTGGGGGIHIINNSNNTATNVVTFYGYNGSQTGSIATFVNTTNYNTSSDARLKENIADADDAASLIDAIKVRKFDWKLNNSHQRYGMVAQELVTVAPEAVSQQADPDDMMSVDYSKLVPMLIKALQELTARVAQLEGNQP